MIADMITSQATHSTAYASKKRSLFLERTISNSLYVKDDTKKSRTSTPKIVQLSDEVIVIKGTISVAF